MRLLLLFFCLQNIFLSASAQINVRVKSTSSSKEIDIKTSGTSNDGKEKTTTKDKPSQASTTSNEDNQGANYTGPAKIYVKTFWEIVTKLKEGKSGSALGLERQIKFTKEKDPTYNTSAMEAEYKIWNEKALQAKDEKIAAEQKKGDDHKAQQQGAWAKVNDEKLLQTVIDGTQMEFGNNNVEFADKAMADYKIKVDEVLKLDLSKYQAKIDDLKRYVDKSHTLATDRIIAKAKTLVKEIKKTEEFEPAVKELQFRQLYWSAVKNIYKGDAICEKYYNEVSTLLKQFGSGDDIKKTAEKNATEAIKNRKLPQALVKDAALEKALIDGFNSKYKEQYKGTAIKVIILQPEWYIEKNALTGVTTGRNKHCALVFKGTDGKCYLMSQLVYAYQDYVGGTFGKTQIVYNGLGGEEMLCENVK